MGRKIVAGILPVVALIGFSWFSQQPSSLFPLLQGWAHIIGPYGFSFIADAISVALALVLVLVTHPRTVLSDLGLDKSPLRPLLFAFIVTLPALIGFALTAKVATDVTLRQFILLGWVFPFAEEVFFRGYVFGQLYARAGWNFWPAALITAVVFAVLHAIQVHDAMEAAGVFAITALGSVVFSYFFLRFGTNIWVPFALHAFLNSWWMVFTINDNALGGLSDNIFRFSCIGLAFGLSYAAYYTPALNILVPREDSFRRKAEAVSAN